MLLSGIYICTFSSRTWAKQSIATMYKESQSLLWSLRKIRNKCWLIKLSSTQLMHMILIMPLKRLICQCFTDWISFFNLAIRMRKGKVLLWMRWKCFSNFKNYKRKLSNLRLCTEYIQIFPSFFFLGGGVFWSIWTVWWWNYRENNDSSKTYSSFCHPYSFSFFCRKKKSFFQPKLLEVSTTVRNFHNYAETMPLSRSFLCKSWLAILNWIALSNLLATLN